jgi:ribosomal protein S18 acetylase RimI-like enzyme
MYRTLRFRPAHQSEVPDLVCLVDIAGRGITAWFWGTLREPGQSALEIGRQRIRTHTDYPMHYKNWTVAEVDGAVAGALVGRPIPVPYERRDAGDLPKPFAPVLELEALAAGSWFLNILALYPEYRGQGLGSAMLSKAEEIGNAMGASQISIIVEGANPSALKLYLRCGYTERARRPYIAFPGSMDEGDWILLMKKITVGSTKATSIDSQPQRS